MVGGRSKEEGLVEIRVKKKWGLVCSDNFGITEAQVVCRQLGYGFAVYALRVSCKCFKNNTKSTAF